MSLSAKPPTIADVARSVSLANSTVADILRNKPGYNEQTRSRVLDAAQKLGYRPNYLSKALAGSKSKTIGVLAALTETPAVATMVRDIELASRRNKYLCYLIDFGGEDEHQLTAHIQNLLDRRIDALIVHQREATDLPEAVNRLLDECNLPVVRMGVLRGDVPHSVCIDRDQAARELGRHLAALGHREAAVVLASYSYRHPDHKLKPLMRGLEAAGIRLDCSERWIVEAGLEYDDGCRKLLEREIRSGNLPTAMLFSSDRYAVQAYAALSDAGLRVPEDVSIVGFDDEHYAASLRPALTTIRQPRGEVGKAAFDLIMQLIKDPQVEIESPMFRCELINRSSTGPARPG